MVFPWLMGILKITIINKWQETQKIIKKEWYIRWVHKLYTEEANLNPLIQYKIIKNILKIKIT